MATSSTERQAQWRARVALRDLFFNQLNRWRVETVDTNFIRDNRPEVVAMRTFFLNYPRCMHPPLSFVKEGDRWLIRFPSVATRYDTAAAAVSMSEATSSAFDIAGPKASAELIEQVRDEVAQMRALGLWSKA